VSVYVNGCTHYNNNKQTNSGASVRQRTILTELPPLIGEISAKIMIMKMFAILDKAKHDIESIRGLNLAEVKHTTIQVTRLRF
jgi:hypothetical protein